MAKTQPKEGFTATQLEQLRGLLGDLERRFDAKLDRRFTEQNAKLELSFAGERTYMKQLLQQELRSIKADLAELKAQVDRLIETEDEDVRAVAQDVKKLERRVAALERAH